MKRIAFIFSVLALFFGSDAFGQTYTDGNLSVQIVLKHPCNSPTNDNGEIQFTILSSEGGVDVDITRFSPSDGPFSVPVGGTLIYPAGGAGNKRFIIDDGTNAIDLFSSPLVLSTVPPITNNGSTQVNNVVCGASNGSIDLEVTGGGAGTYSYLWADGPTTQDRTNLISGTYSVTIANTASKCTLDLSFDIEDPQPLDFTIATSTPSVCTGDNIIITVPVSEASVTYQLQVNGVNQLASQTGPGILTYTLPTSSYVSGQSIRVLATLAPCLPKYSDNTLTVVENPLPVPALGGNTSVCLGSTGNVYTTDPGMTNYIWTVVGGNITSGGGASDNTATVTWTSAVTPSVEVSYTDGNGCTAATPTKLNVTVNSIDATLNTSVNNSKCTAPYNGSATITITGGGATGYTFAWTGPGGFTANTQNIANAQNGSYSVTVTDNTTGCADILPVTIGDARPTIDATVNTIVNNSRCVAAYNGSATINITGGGATGYTFAWTGPGGFTANTQNIANAQNGSYSVTVTDNTTGCFDVLPVTIGDARPTIDATVNTIVDNSRCVAAYNGSATINITGGGATGYTFAWTGPGGFTANTQNIANAQNGSYSVTVTDNTTGCSDVLPVTIGDARPTIDATVNTIVNNSRCVAAYNGSATINITGGGATGYTFAWTGPGGFTANTQNIANAQNGSYSVTVTDNTTGCSDVLPVTIGDARPTIDATVNTIVNNSRCVAAYNGSATINITGGGATGYTFAWTGPGGFTANTQNIANIQNGSYSVTVTDNTTGCSDVLPVTIGDARPTIDATVNTIVNNSRCVAAYNGSATINISGGGATGYTFAWTGPGGFTANTQNIANAQNGSYSVTVTDNTTGCSDVLPVTIGDARPTIDATVNTIVNNSRCIAPFNGSASINISGGGATGYTFAWTGPGAFSASTQNITTVEDGSYSVTVTDNTTGCSDVLPVTIGDGTPTIDATVNTIVNNSRCFAPFNGTASINISGGGVTGYSFAWTGPGGFTASTQNIATVEHGSYSVTVTDNTTGCSDILPVTIGDARPAIDATVNAIVNNSKCLAPFNGSATINITGGGATGYTFAWTGPGGFTASTQNIATVEHGSYSVTVTDNTTGCSDILPVTVGDTRPTIDATVNAIVDNSKCLAPFNGSATINITGGGATGYTFAWTGPGGFTANTQNIATVEDGNYSVTVTDNSTGCSDILPVTIGDAAPTIDATVNAIIDNSRCLAPFNGSASINITGGGATGYTFAWTGPGGFTASTQNIATVEDGNYSVTVTDNTTGCSDVLPVTIGDATPTIDATVNTITDNSRCVSAFNGSATINITGGGATGYTFAWTGPGGFTANTQNIANVQNGSYSVTVTDNTTGCADILPVTIGDTRPTIDATVNIIVDNSRCVAAFNGSASINITGGGATGYTFAWTGPGAFTANTQNIANAEQGNYSVTVTDNTTGCSDILAVVIGDARPTIDATVNTIVDNSRCVAPFNGSASINITGGGVTGYTFAWTGPGGFTGNTQNIATVEDGSYSVTVTDNTTGCTDILPVTIGDAKPTIDATVNTIVDNSRCVAAFNGSATINIIGGGATGYTFAWTGPGGFIASTQNIANVEHGSYSVTVTDNTTGCSDVLPVTVGDARPTIDATVNTIVDNTQCGAPFDGSASINITGGGATGYTFAWTGPNLFTANTQNIATAEHGSYSVTVTDNTTGCSDVLPVTIGDARPTIDVTVNTIVDNTKCIAAFDGSATINITGGGATGYSFAWTGPNLFTASTQNIVNAEDGNYTVTVTDNATGCSDVLLVVIGNARPTIDATVNTIVDNNRCTAPFDGSATINVTGGGTTGYTFAWTGPGGFTANTQNIANAEDGSYSVTVTDNSTGCFDVLPVTIGNASVVVDATLNAIVDNSRCTAPFDGSASINVSGGGATGYTFAWTGPGGFTANTQNIANVEHGNYSVTVTDNTSGCSDVLLVTIGDIRPTIDATVNTIVDNSRCAAPFNGSATINITGGGATGYTFVWTGPNGFTASTQNITNAEDGSYSVTVTDNSSGCSDVLPVIIGDITPIISHTSSIVDATCSGVNNGSITVTTVSGGTGPYEYSIDGGLTFQASNSFSNLATGDYDVLARDIPSGCVSPIESITINATTAVIPTISKTDASCLGVANGSIQVTGIMGGTAPYSYSNDNGVTYQASGTFGGLSGGSNHSIVVMDASGCLSSAFSIIINNTTTISATISKIDVSSCVGNDGEISISTPTGGTAPYQYSIDNGATFQLGDIFSGLLPGNYDVVVLDDNGCRSTSATISIGVISNIIAVVTKTDADCNGVPNGSIEVTSITGGTAPFEYSIDNGANYQATSTFNGLAGGTNHAVIVRDAKGCLSSVVTININAITTITTTITKTDVSSCVGTNGSIQITASNGTAPYDYSIDNGATFVSTNTFNSLTPGDYELIVRDASGCLTTAETVSINVIGNIVAVVSKDDASCSGVENGVITIASVTGGAAPYEYSINNGVDYVLTNVFSNLEGNANYAVVVKDANGCLSSVSTIHLSNDSTLTVSTIKTDVSGCVGTNGSIQVTADHGTTPYQYSVNNGVDFQVGNTFNALLPGTYHVVVQDNIGCETEEVDVTIDVVDNIVPVIAKTVASCNGIEDGTITVTSVTGGVPPYQYSNDNGLTFQLPNTFTNLAAGDYSVIVKDASNCVSSVHAVIIHNDLLITMDVNKTDETCAGGDGTITITNASGGTEPYQFSIDNGVSFQLSGTYDSLDEAVFPVIIKDAGGCLSEVESVAVSTDCDGNNGGTGQCATVQITPSSTPANCSLADGTISFDINPAVPANNILGVVISIFGPDSITQYNNFEFNALHAGFYKYQIIYGDSITAGCIKNGSVTVLKAGTAGSAVASDAQAPLCYQDSTGSVTIDITQPVDLTGQALQWSLTPGVASSWKEFTAGGTIVGIPAGLPPTYKQTISIRKDETDPCYTGVEVTIIPVSDPLTVNFETLDATCGNNDGSITEILPGGGTQGGSIYTFSIDAGLTYQEENEFTELSSGIYKLLVKDQVGCTKEFTAVVESPNFIEFTSETVVPANCSNNGMSGKIIFEFQNPGTYKVGISTNPSVLPSKYRMYNTSGIPLVFDSLTRGDYYVFVESTGSECSIGQGPYTVDGIFAVDFDMVPQCVGTDLSFSLTNITGDPDKPMEVRVYRKFTEVQVASVTIDPFPATASYYFEKSQHAFLQTPDEYQIEIVQIDDISGCQIKSDLKDYVVPFGMDADVGTIQESFPDIASGMINVINFAGGVTPYEVRIELDSATSLAFPIYETDFEEVGANTNNQQLEKEYKNIPPGRYTVQIMDSLGCTLELITRVPMDHDLVIPNIMTPNDDGVNDVFFVRNLPDGNSKLVITNRWGKEIYSSNNYQNDWKGEEAADGVYFYRLQVINSTTAITGWVEILRGQKP